MWNSNRRQRGGGLGVMLLFSQIIQFGVDKIPPVTLCLIAGQVLIFLEAVPQLQWYFPSANGVCMSLYLVYNRRQWQRLFLGTFYHADDMHLFFNMVSLLWKGSMLEKRLTSVKFACLCAMFTTLTGLTYIGINRFLANALEDDSYLTTCAVGFSGVLFAFKVLTTHYTPPGLHYVMGTIPVPSRMLYWVELVLISVMSPNASFTGHLAGILVGLLYIYTPLSSLFTRRVHFTVHFTDDDDGFLQQYYHGSNDDDVNENSIQNSRRGQQSNLYPDLEELRQRRLDRYN